MKIRNIVMPLLAVTLAACTTGSQDLVSHFPKNPTIHDQVLITLDEAYYLDESIQEVTIDASELGVPNEMVMDRNLNALSVAIEDDTQPGEKQILITVKTDGKVETLQETVLVKEIEEQDDLTFSWEEARIYFALTDRFYNGDPTNDDPNNQNYDRTHPETYHGGDFQGLIDKMAYLEELGINTLWITPIVDNIEWNARERSNDYQYGYHGYWAKDFTQLDEHLGSLDTFKRLIDTAHDHGIKLMVDVVLNHAGYGMDEGDTDLRDMLRENPTANHQVLGELAGLPDFKTEEASVRDQLVAWQTAWIEESRTERGDTIDYFRVDTIKHVEDTTWKAFKNELIKVQPDFKLLGEHYGAAITATGGYHHDGEMDSLLDFDFKNIAGSFVNWDVIGANEQLIARNEQLSSDATMGQFLSSHDEDGFLYRQAGGDEGKQKVAASLLVTAKGQPVIYYGEELGQTGPNAKNMDQGEYSENRYDFDWEAVSDSDMHQHYQKLLTIRKQYSQLFSRGSRATVSGSNQEGYVIFSRSYKGQELYIGLNILDEATKIPLALPENVGGTVTDLYTGKTYPVSENGTLSVTIPARSVGGTIVLAFSED